MLGGGPVKIKTCLERLTPGRLTFGRLTADIFLTYSPLVVLVSTLSFYRMLRKIKKASKAIKNIGTRSSSRHSSRHSEMSVDPAPQQAPSSSSAPRIKVLLKPGDLDLKSRREKDIYQQLKGRYFIHTPTLDPLLLLETGMGTEFDLIFRMLEWTNFWDITELGSRLLTIEFLCTLQICEGGIVFRMFKQDIMLSWRELSDHLGFSPRCLLDIDTGLPNFDRNQFWREISRDLSFNQP